MLLMTKKIEKELLTHPYNENIQPGDRKVIVMYFNPLNYNHQWYIVSGEKLPDGDWELFGLIHVDDWEWGYVNLSDLEAVKLPMMRHIERDKEVFNQRLEDVLKKHGVSGYEEYIEPFDEEDEY